MLNVFDLKFEMPLPSLNEREKIFEILLRQKPLNDNINLPELSKLTENLTGGDIDSICRRAAMKALKRENFELRREDFEL